MGRRPSKSHIAWYQNARGQYLSLADIVAATLETLLRSSRISFLSVTRRAKTVESFTEKLRRKRYSDPKIEMTDLAGIRVITYIERDVERVSELIQKSFNVHQQDSVNKATELGADRVGYRSVHFICDVGETRRALPEFSAYGGLIFEIQVRTVLQHAWAEIEHDRSYKFSGELPSMLTRRFRLVAGLLELADREFDVLTAEIEKYAAEVERSTKAGKLDIEINSTSVEQYLLQKLSQTPGLAQIEQIPIREEILEELGNFGVRTLTDLDRLFSAEFVSAEARHMNELTTYGILRDVMMYHDIERYFENSWDSQWQGIDEEAIKLLAEKYSEKKVRKIVRKYRLDILPAGYREDE